MTRRRRPQRPPRPFWPAWLLALALLQAQALGLWHGIAHGLGTAVAAEAAADGHDVFGHAAGDQGQCRLYDALGSAAGPCPASVALPAVIVAAAPAAERPQPPAARGSRPYEARAPPARG